ncbi:apicortin, putative [Plasmodium knowlesi strain H]|uniref:Apicortin, putative n=3 Tax=Plasmodium knowlesi TaxID=5850 RepID=A0A5K1UQE2_PLAKH|nr:uncharacterized protein PKNH_1015500 [Plasmodium knowlesi strain H]OTN66967.1 putative Apicortin [Plasmodium knowlesi]CAA9988661.1 apicortin, putative [Plasmodium knowlesi strain H]SBO21545.1 apicortin, putative [Plasmodium knowlesi strain H]SBO21935.1 apicortin, putative [Plasmodium knowlesi strain H]VVS78135.1 apicortin, putative [Plasmodium knowlesi strain H]|eukprot:XP_002259638.1 [Plasmodium knowlesi strain H]
MDYTNLYDGALSGSSHFYPDGDLQSVKKHCTNLSEIAKMNFPLEVGIPKEKERRRHENVFDRLTDENFYTGMHKQKFDALRRRAASKGICQNLKLKHLQVEGGGITGGHPPRTIFQKKCKTSVVTPGTLGMQKYGIQIAQPKNIWLFRNGDEHHNGLLFLVKPHVNNWKSLLSEITKVLSPTIGPVRIIYNANFRLVRTVKELNDGEKYLCTSGEPPARVDRLTRFLSPWVMHANNPHAG